MAATDVLSPKVKQIQIATGIRASLKDLLTPVVNVSPTNQPTIWNVPYPRNALFTGREAELYAIEAALSIGQPAAIVQAQAISGLGGIGKVQLALEYAYRHRDDYRFVFWTLAELTKPSTPPTAKWREVLGEQHPDTAMSLNSLAIMYNDQRKEEQALAIYQTLLGDEHPETARCVSNLALLYQKQEKYTDALPLFERVLAIRQAKIGPAHPRMKTAQSNVEETLRAMLGNAEERETDVGQI